MTYDLVDFRSTVMSLTRVKSRGRRSVGQSGNKRMAGGTRPILLCSSRTRSATRKFDYWKRAVASMGGVSSKLPNLALGWVTGFGHVYHLDM